MRTQASHFLVFFLVSFFVIPSTHADDKSTVIRTINRALLKAYQRLDSSHLDLARETVKKKALILRDTPELERYFAHTNQASLGFKPWDSISMMEGSVAHLIGSTDPDGFRDYSGTALQAFPAMKKPFVQMATEATLSQFWHPHFSSPSDDYLGDAYRHLYWSALLSKYFGTAAALFLTATHEIKKKPGQPWQVPDPDNTGLMDLGNNLIGISLGSRMKNQSDADIRHAIIHLIYSGKAIMLDPYHIQKKNIVRGLSRTMSWQDFLRTPAYQYRQETLEDGIPSAPARCVDDSSSPIDPSFIEWADHLTVMLGKNLRNHL